MHFKRFWLVAAQNILRWSFSCMWWCHSPHARLEASLFGLCGCVWVLLAPTVVPRPRPPAPRGAVVRLIHELLTSWLSLHISLSPLGYFARQRCSCSTYPICVHTFVTVCVISTTKASACKMLFISCFFSSAFETQCLFTPSSPCHGSWCQRTEWPALLHQWSDQHRDGDR